MLNGAPVPEPAAVAPDPAVAAPLPVSTTPLLWRLALGIFVLALGLAAYLLREKIGPRGQALAGVFCIIGFVGMLSADLRAVNWRTLVLGIALQWVLALFILKFYINGFEWAHIPPDFAPGQELFQAIASAAKLFLGFADDGARFVFGPLADEEAMGRVFGPGSRFVFAFRALPTIIFVSSFFMVLYHIGVLPWIVRLFARMMVYLLRTSGAESLCVTANVVMGQTEAPLIVKPYVARMTDSELFTMMVGGMAHISGGLMAVYIQMGADPVAILATSVMAAPCAIYLSKLLNPERAEPETRGIITSSMPSPYRNTVDAAAAGASDGLFLALNVAAMLIAFLAFLALIDYLLVHLPRDPHGLQGWLFDPAVTVWGRFGRLLLALLGYVIVTVVVRRAWRAATGRTTSLPLALRCVIYLVGFAAFLVALEWLILAPEPLSLKLVFSKVFAPLAFLMGVDESDVPAIADLLGTKLALNEFVAYVELTRDFRDSITPRSFKLATYALTGFANFSSIGIQIGGIGALAPNRRGDLARLGGRALLVGFLATVLNAAVAGILIED